MNNDENKSSLEKLSKLNEKYKKDGGRHYGAVKLDFELTEIKLQSTQELITAIDKQLEASNRLSEKIHIKWDVRTL